MDSLFNTSFESSASPHSLPSVKLKAHTYELQESNVRLKVQGDSHELQGREFLKGFSDIMLSLLFFAADNCGQCWIWRPDQQRR